MIRVASAQSEGGLLPDMTALLDVITLMLIFLILIAHPATRVLEIALPDASAAQTAATDAVVVTLLIRESGWELGGQEFSDWPPLAVALERALQRHPAAMLRIQGDRNAPVQRLVRVLDHARSRDIAIAELEVDIAAAAAQPETFR